MLGISVVVIAGFSVAAAELLVGRPLFEEHRGHLAVALGALGLLAWFIGRCLAQQRAEYESTAHKKVTWLFDLRYWGKMLIVWGGIILCIQTLADDEAFVRRLLGMEGGKKAVARAAAPKASSVIFPSLKIQGIIIRDARSAVIVNGNSYLVGDRIGDVTVKEITRDAVTLEKLNEVKIISLTQSTSASGRITNAGK